MSITLASSLIGLGLYLGSLLWLGTRSRTQEHADADTYFLAVSYTHLTLPTICSV